MDPSLTLSNVRRVIDGMFSNEKNLLIKHQLNSFNNFMSDTISTIIKQYNPITLYGSFDEEIGKYKHEIYISFGDICCHPPMNFENDGSMLQMSPEQARLRNLTYSSNIHVNIEIETVTNSGDIFENREVDKKHIKNVLIGKIPIMVGSNYCNHRKSKQENYDDIGGYFVISGSEKVIISQERQAENKSFCFKNNSVSSTKFSHVCEVKSQSNVGFMPAKPVSVKYSTKSNNAGNHFIHVSFQGCKKDIPLAIIFKALDIESDKLVCNNVFGLKSKSYRKEFENYLKASLEEVSGYTTPMALEFITKHITIPTRIRNHGILTQDKRIQYTRRALKNDFLPHLNTNKEKALYLGHMTLKLIKFVKGIIQEDDRDSFENKRVDTPGVMLGNLFRQSFTKLIKDATSIINREINYGSWKITNQFHNIITENNIYKIFKSNIIESNLKYSLATGNWGVKNATVKVGVAQVLQRLSYFGTLSHLRRFNTPIDKTTKMTKPRKLHPSTYGYICPAETPEGAACGLVKNMALACEITTDSLISSIEDRINTCDGFIRTIDIDIRIDYSDYCYVNINGRLIGLCVDMIDMKNVLIGLRRDGFINMFTGIVADYANEIIDIYTKSGRLSKPVFVVKNMHKISTIDYTIQNYWKKLIQENVIEYLEVQENATAYICEDSRIVNLKYTHSEIDPSLLLGVLASNIVFCNHNQSPRNCYQSAMGKQAMSVYNTNYRNRMDTISNVIWYPTKALVETHNSKYMNFNTPNGTTVIIAIASDKGFNQEDSLIFNKSAIERGLFRSSFFRTYHVEEKKNQSTGEEENFAKPNPNNTLQLRHCSYDAIDEKTGFPKIGARVCGGDAIIGKIVPVHNKKKNSNASSFDKEFRDNSTYTRNNEGGVIDTTYVSRNAEGYVFCKTKIRSERIPEMGDKFSSRHGQKGTIGFIYNACDMPYTSNGVIPDIIMNPHAIPSRMTCAQLLESLFGVLCAETGTCGDGSPFNGISVDLISKNLDKMGFDKFGESKLYSGESGREYPTNIFMGPTFYQRLKHMVDDKMHARATGPVVQITRQPTEGRSRSGGLRVGEMERDVFIAHGAMGALKEKFMELSDKYTVYTNDSGVMCAVNPDKNLIKSFSKKSTKIHEHRIPYAMKLFLQEIATLGISCRLKTNRVDRVTKNDMIE